MTLVSSRLLLVALVALPAAACQTKDLPPQPNFVSYADGGAAPKKNDERYFIEFRSRYALSYGHTYAVFGRLDRAGRMIDPQVAGLHPASNSAVPYVLGHIVPVPAETGWSDGDLEEPYRSASWQIILTRAEYDKVVAYIRKLQASSHVWQATVLNCNGFVADIAHSMGYKTPAIQLRPQQFITKLREMNT
ncbi:hypothetical protein [Mesorhizobium sp. M0909]|uniref:hypothetical protein n=1 Tax=Mesorhizobium sp. M0909 TaxID=2957024 RepID=UPI0033363046